MKGLKETIRDIFDAQISSYEDEPFFECTIYADRDMVEEMIEWEADKINRDMCKYLHMKDHSIVGNFNNVERDYIYHEQRGDYNDFRDMIQRLDDGVDDERTNDDRDWLTAWFWETFGTWAMGYNLSTDIGEALYIAEEEYAEAV